MGVPGGVQTRRPAGLAGPPTREESTDGHELTFQVNYLSGYLLTRLLLPTLTAPARIVNVSSVAQQPIDFDDVMLTRGYPLKSRKNARMSSVSRSGASTAGKCPPRSNSVQWTTS